MGDRFRPRHSHSLRRVVAQLAAADNPQPLFSPISFFAPPRIRSHAFLYVSIPASRTPCLPAAHRVYPPRTEARRLRFEDQEQVCARHVHFTLSRDSERAVTFRKRSRHIEVRVSKVLVINLQVVQRRRTRDRRIAILRSHTRSAEVNRQHVVQSFLRSWIISPVHARHGKRLLELAARS